MTGFNGSVPFETIPADSWPRTCCKIQLLNETLRLSNDHRFLHNEIAYTSFHKVVDLLDHNHKRCNKTCPANQIHIRTTYSCEYSEMNRSMERSTTRLSSSLPPKPGCRILGNTSVKPEQSPNYVTNYSRESVFVRTRHPRRHGEQMNGSGQPSVIDRIRKT
jgi:hypothetical protein